MMAPQRKWTSGDPQIIDSQSPNGLFLLFPDKINQRFSRIYSVAPKTRYPNRITPVLLTILLMVSATCSFAQFSIPITLDERVSHSALIIEGKVTDKTAFWDSDHRLIYTLNRVAVDKIFKGSVPADTIDVVTTGGISGQQGLIVSDEAVLDQGSQGVFLLNPHRNATKLPSYASKAPYEMFAASQGMIHYDMQSHTAADMNEQYGDITGGLLRLIIALTGSGVQVLHPALISFSALGVTAPVISSFSPSVVHAGAILDPTNNVLTINGTGFGSGSGSAAVVFTSADNPSATISIAYNSLYVVSWSPTKVVVKVPYGAGTGNLGVTDASGTTVNAGTALTVDYNIMSITYGGPAPAAGAYQVKPMNLNGSGGITVVYSTSNANGGADFSSSSEHLAFERAADTWVKTSGYNLTVSGTTSSQSVSNDGVNIIMFDNTATGVSVLPSGVLGVTYTWIGGCSDGTWFLTGFDMVFRRAGVSAGSTITFNSTTCAPGSGEVDFEAVALHELGHSHTLGHVVEPLSGNDPAKVMHYAVSLGRFRRSLDYSSLAASTYALTPSGLSYACSPYTSEMTALANQRPALDNCPPSFPATPTASGSYAINLYYSTSDRTADPSATQMNCGGSSIGRYNSVMLPIFTGGSGTTLSLSVTNYTTLVDYSACSGMGVKLALFQVSSCPGTSWPAALNCQSITGNGPLTSISGLSSNTNYMLVFDGLLNTKAKFDLALSGSVLPVNLVDLKAIIVHEKATLTWSTLAEKDNKGFQVEKSTNGKDFSVIGMVPGMGNSALKNDYRFTDPAPLSDVQQYRLRQLDIDGHSSLSEVVTLRSSDAVADNSFRVVNPVGGSIRIQFDAWQDGPVNLTLYDIQGRLVMNRTMTMSGNSVTVPVDRSLVAHGTYVLCVQGRSIHDVKKLLID